MHSIIGAIVDPKTNQSISELSAMKSLIDAIQEARDTPLSILKFSKEHNSKR